LRSELITVSDYAGSSWIIWGASGFFLGVFTVVIYGIIFK
jgi:hypothetical protein